MMAFIYNSTFTLAEVTAKATLLLVLAGIIVLCSKRASASFRHLIWMLCLAAILILPVLSLRLPHWQVPVMTPPTHLQTKVADETALPVDTPQATPKFETATATHPQPSVHLPIVPHTAPAPPQAVTQALAPIQAISPAPPHPIAPKPSLPWQFWMLLVWSGGVLLMLVRLAQGGMTIRRIVRASAPMAIGAFVDMMQVAAKAMGVTLPVALRLAHSTSQVTVPITYGTLRPVIVLPAAAEDWPEERLRAALLHEMAHIRRHDWLLQVIAHVTRSIYWFHPIVWIAVHRMRAESETACDDLVLNAGMPAKDYARHLLDVAMSARQSRSLSPGAVAMAQTPRVEGRLKTILSQGLSRRPVTAMTATRFTTIALLLVLPIASLRLSAQREAVSAPVSSGATVANPKTTQVTLPNGVTVRLAGVADMQTHGLTRWWAADGSPVTEPLPKNTPIFAKLPAGVRGRAFAVSTSYDTTAQPRSIWTARPNFAWAYAHASKDSAIYSVKPNVTWEYEPGEPIKFLNHYQDQETKQGLKTHRLTIDAIISQQKAVVLKYGVAAGPWTESVTCKNTPGKVTIKTSSGDVIFTLIPNPHHLSAALAARGNARFMVSDHFRTPSPLATANSLQVALRAGENFDRDVVGLDSAGRVVMDLRGSLMTDPDGPQGDYRSVKTMQATSIPNSLLKRIASFRLLARPFQWAEFRDIQLQPQVAALISSQTPNAAAATAHVALGRKAQERGQPRDGIPEFRRAVALNPDNAEAQNQLAQALYQINDKRVGTTTYAHPAPPAVLDEAIRHMKKYVDLLPFDPASQSTLGTYLENRGRYTEAIAYYRRALHLLSPPSPQPESPRTDAQTEIAQQIFENQWLLGDVLLKTGRYSEAVVQYQAALRSNHKAFWVLLGYGDALNKIGRRTEARAAWKKIIEVEGLDNYYGRQAKSRLANG